MQGPDRAAHVARCARVCYASMKDTGNDKLVEHLQKNGHTSMFRHESRYYIVRNVQAMKTKWVLHYLQNSDYAAVYVLKKKTAYISTNGQFVREHQTFFDNYLGNNEVSAGDFVSEAMETKVKAIQMLIRHTICLSTQIGTSRELNRKSPNAIAEQSTRYVNFGKRGGITICRPWWMQNRPFYLPMPGRDADDSEMKPVRHHLLCSMLMRLGWHVDDLIYRALVRLGMKPQDARGKLPLEAATRVVYTYNGFEWKHIFDLRVRQTTGKAQPDAIIAACMIREVIYNQLHTLGIYGLEL